MRYTRLAIFIMIVMAFVGHSLAAQEPAHERTSILEGVLKVHPKFLYHYYLKVSPNQYCAVYGPKHERKPDVLSHFKAGNRIRIEGALGTYHHPGSTDKNPSPFPRTWVIYMDVHKAQLAGDPVSDR